MYFSLEGISSDVIRVSLVSGLTVAEAWVLQCVVDQDFSFAVDLLESFMLPDSVLLEVNTKELGHTPLTLGILGLLKCGAYEDIKERLEEILDRTGGR
jgi:hypothetical protein